MRHSSLIPVIGLGLALWSCKGAFEERSPCTAVTCSGHGQCAEVGEGTRPVCLCDLGFRAEGLDCVPDTADGDADTDTDIDGDGDIDGDTDVDADTDSDADTDVDTDVDGDVETDSDADLVQDGDPDPEDGGVAEDADATDADLDAYFPPVWNGSCARDDDCLDGLCIQVPERPGGYWTCALLVEEATSGGSTTDDECRYSDDCGAGCGCYTVSVCLTSCRIYNACVCDECSGDGDCDPGELCVPGGAFGFIRRTCAPTINCVVVDDCPAGPERRCEPFFDPCNGSYIGSLCTYADSFCRSADACSDGYSCVIDGLTQTPYCDLAVCPY